MPARSLRLPAVILLTALCAPAEAAAADSTPPRRDLIVFAAGSTTDVMNEIAGAYRQRTGRGVRVIVASSSTLARQIQKGAPADVFVSANPHWMDVLQQTGRIDPATRRDVASNRMVLVAAADRRFAVRMDRTFDLAGAFEGRMAMGNPEHVPAGVYAKTALRSMGWWDAVAGRVTPTRNVRTALRLVELGEAGAGVVYRTDAMISPKVAIVGTFPADSHAGIVYPAAVCTKGDPQAADFVAFLAEPDALVILGRHGFGPPPHRAATQPASPAPTPDEDQRLTEPILLSLKVAGGCAIAILLPGVACGWLLARKTFPGKTLLNVLVHLPLVVPPVVTGYLLLLLLGRQGPVGAWLNDWFGVELAFAWTGAVVAAMVMSFPLMVRSVRLAMELVDPQLEQAAKTLGASPVRTFVTVTLPLAAPGILAGLILAFARSLGEFGATIMFCGNIPGRTRTIPLAIYAAFEQQNRQDEVLALGLMSVALSLAALLGSELLARRIHRRIGAAR